MKKVAFLCCLFCGLITQAVGAIYNCKQQVVDSRTVGGTNLRNFLIMVESEWEDSIALLCGTPLGLPSGINGCEKGTNVGVVGKFYYEGNVYDIADIGLLFECDDEWRPIKAGDIEECSSTDGLTLIGVGGNHDEYAAYASFGELVKYEGGYYTLFDEVCFVEDKKTDKTNASEKESAQDAGQKQSSDGTSAQDAGQNQSGDAGKNSKKESEQGAGQKQPGGAGKNSKKESGQDAKQTKSGGGMSGQDAGQTQSGDAGKNSKKDSGQGTGQNQSGDAGKNSKKDSEQGANQNQSGDARKNSEKESGQGTGQKQSGDAEKKSKEKSGQDAGQTQPGGGTAGQVQSTASKVQALTQKIKNAASQLDSISSKKFKVSEWKDAEGKFNTARLASDSIAGVVLGTAGGLITSLVVKKNQVENGFQDIKCTIGGQSVANWGDEFSVGIQ